MSMRPSMLREPAVIRNFKPNVSWRGASFAILIGPLASFVNLMPEPFANSCAIATLKQWSNGYALRRLNAAIASCSVAHTSPSESSKLSSRLKSGSFAWPVRTRSERFGFLHDCGAFASPWLSSCWTRQSPGPRSAWLRMIRCAHAWSASLKRCCGSRGSPARATDAVASAASAVRSRPRRRAMWPESASTGGDFLPRKGHIAEVRPEPALGLFDRDPLACGVVLHLVEAEPADGEVARKRMREVDPADGGGGTHCERLGQRHARGVLGAEQLEELVLLGVVRGRRV